MRGTFLGLEIGRTGLTTAQFGLDVTGHNISNLDTEGYTRQRIVQTAYDPFSTIGKFAPVGQGLVGGGTRVKILDQIRSAFLDRRFRDEVSTHAYWETRTQSLSYVESFFDNVNEKTSINYSIAQFFGSMTEVAKDPVSGAPRTLMQTTAMDFVQQLNMIYEGLIDLQKVENRAIETKVNLINDMAEDLRDLNVAIYTFELTGMIANDLRDKRNLLLDELAKIADIEYKEYPDQFGHSMMEVKLAGSILVDHDRVNELTIAWEQNVLGPDEEPVAIPIWKSWTPDDYDPHNPEKNVLSESTISAARFDKFLKSGELKAHIDMRDGFGGTVNNVDKGIPYYIDMVNNLARSMMMEINGQHIQGWSDHPDGSKTGILFFEVQGLTYPDGTEIDFNDFVVFYDDSTPPVPMDKTAAGFDPADAAFKRFEVPDDVLYLVTAKNLTLSKEVEASAYNIAASSVEIGRPTNAGTSGDPEQLQRGNNENIKDMYELFRKTGITIFGDTRITKDIGSFDEFGTTIRFDVGTTLNSAKQLGETSRILLLAADNQRTAVAGVSLDEEMVGLVKFNHAYNGAARVITQMDDALDRLINGTGRVGL